MKIRIERPTRGIMGVMRWRVYVVDRVFDKILIGDNADRTKALKQSERKLQTLLNQVSKRLDP